MSRRWIALFSQTGSEIKNIAEELGHWPDEIVTNNFNNEQWEPNIHCNMVGMVTATAINSYLRSIDPQDVFVTLHGYLRILPADICDRIEIYNGHPAFISEYPELKGKDPQEKTWAGMPDGSKYPMIGSVVHRCTAELDAGEIVSAANYINRCDSKEELYNKLKQASLIAWLHFLRGKV